MPTYIIAAVVSFAVCVLLAPWGIKILKKLKFGQEILEIGPSWHAAKRGTPTMGGLLFIFSTLLSVLVVSVNQAVFEHFFDTRILLILGCSLCFSVIGFIDDYSKIKKKENAGLSARQKYLMQLVVAGTFIYTLYLTGYFKNVLYIPFTSLSVTIPWPLYVLFSLILITGIVNAVNLTDGIDGLASSVTLLVMAFFMSACLLFGSESTAVVPAAVAGGLMGFLFYNFYPAKLFMGDTGSLFLGGIVASLGFVFEMLPLYLFIVGIIYIIEAFSVMLQVFVYKTFNKKRLFLMTPIHHHFEKKGWSEVKIVMVFTTITALACLLGYWGMMS